MSSTHERRERFLQKMVGKTVEVHSLHDLVFEGWRPEKDPTSDIYIPLPEYEIALILRKDPKESTP